MFGLSMQIDYVSLFYPAMELFVMLKEGQSGWFLEIRF